MISPQWREFYFVWLHHDFNVTYYDSCVQLKMELSIDGELELFSTKLSFLATRFVVKKQQH